MYTNNQRPQPGRGRRTYSPEFKAQLVAACRIPGMSVASVARNHGINHNILHRWLRELPDPAALRLPQTLPAPSNLRPPRSDPRPALSMALRSRKILGKCVRTISAGPRPRPTIARPLSAVLRPRLLAPQPIGPVAAAPTTRPIGARTRPMAAARSSRHRAKWC